MITITIQQEAVLFIGITLIHIQVANGPGGEMADARDLKSLIRKGVWVRVPPRAIPLKARFNQCFQWFKPNYQCSFMLSVVTFGFMPRMRERDTMGIQLRKMA